ncbi:MAG: hypothetical protein K2X81_08510, partial [Candidatus Obscuribacterales bacterium]|nr:hypothetical protein [Candidatus Obscuribacterales bacterium]
MTEEEFDPLSIFKNLFQNKKEHKNSNAEGKQNQSGARSKFLDWMERLDHSERIRRVIELGKESLSADAASSDYAKSLLAELSQGSFYEKQLALTSCRTSKDKAMILHFCSDSSRMLRKLANSLAMLYCEDSDVLSILTEAKKNERVKLLAQLKQKSRVSTVDLFLEKLREENHDDLYSLVYFGSTEFVKKSLAQVQERMSSADATRFAYAHPELCVQFLKDYAKTCSREDPRLFSLFWGATKWISEFCPDGTIELIDELLPLYAAQKIVPINLMYLRPAKIVSTLKKQSEYGGADFRPILSKLPDSTVLELVSQRQIANSITSKFDRLSPELRLTVFEKCSEGWRNADGAIAASLIELLPAKQRIQQAQINLSLANLATKPELQMNYLRLLEFDELKASIKDAISNPDLDSRGQAFFALVYSLKFNRDKLGETLELLHQRKNEPDPVREKFLSALSFLPPSMFKEESLPQLDLIIADAMNAQDLSYGSLSATGKSLLRLFPFHKSWVRDHLKKLLRD